MDVATLVVSIVIICGTGGIVKTGSGGGAGP